MLDNLLAIFKSKLTITEKIFITFRYLSNPFDEIIFLISKFSSILDIGCGHGLLEFLLKVKGYKGKVIAFDPDLKKITSAKTLLDNEHGFVFKSNLLYNRLKKQKFDCVILMDVDYLLNEHTKIKMLKNIKKILNKNGYIILKTVIKTKKIGFYLGYLQEIITVFLLKKTFFKEKKFRFMTENEYTNLLTRGGFQIIINRNIGKKYHYHPHHLFIAKAT